MLDGADGSGTSTQLALLENVEKTFEPTDGPIGKIIRLALKKEPPLTPIALALLFTADREEHLHNFIIPRCKAGLKVVSDRYVISSLVYQGLVCDEEYVARINNFLQPEMIIFLDIAPEKSFERINSRGKDKEIFEVLEFQKKVYERYKKYLGILEKEGVTIKIIDATQSISDIHEQMKHLIFGRGKQNKR